MLIGEGGVGKTTLATALRIRGLDNERALETFLTQLKANLRSLTHEEFGEWFISDLWRHAEGGEDAWKLCCSKFDGELNGAKFLGLDASDVGCTFGIDGDVPRRLFDVHRLFQEDTPSLVQRILSHLPSFPFYARASSTPSPYAFLLDLPHIWTAGVDAAPWRVSEEKTVAIFDFAGQMEFFPAHQLFLWSQHAIYTIVFDAQRSLDETFELISGWLHLLAANHKASHPPAVVVLVSTFTDKLPGGKCDYLPALVLRLGSAFYGIVDISLERAYQPHYAEMDGGGVEALREQLLELARARDDAYPPLPEPYVEVADKLVAKADKLAMWPVVDLAALEIPPELDTAAVIATLEDLAFLRRADDDTFILNPMMWLSRMLGALLHPRRGLPDYWAKRDDPDLPTITGGKLVSLINSWPSSTIHLAREHEEQILPLLAKFDICFELCDGMFVFPTSLPELRPVEDARHLSIPASHKTVTARRYVLKDEHSIIIPALPVALMRICAELAERSAAARVLFLRRGYMVLSVGDVLVRVLVLEEARPRCIDIIVSGPSQHAYFTIQPVLDAVTSAFVVALGQTEAGGSDMAVRFEKHMLVRVGDGDGGEVHPVLGFGKVLAASTALQPMVQELLAGGENQYRFNSKCRAVIKDSLRLSHDAQRLELHWRDDPPPGLFLLCTAERLVHEESPHRLPRPDPGSHTTEISLQLRRGTEDNATVFKLYTPPVPIIGLEADLWHFASTLLQPDPEHLGRQRVLFDSFWDRFGRRLHTMLLDRLLKRDLRHLRPFFESSGSSPPQEVVAGGSAGAGTVLTRADWDFLVVLTPPDVYLSDPDRDGKRYLVDEREKKKKLSKAVKPATLGALAHAYIDAFKAFSTEHGAFMEAYARAIPADTPADTPAELRLVRKFGLPASQDKPRAMFTLSMKGDGGKIYDLADCLPALHGPGKEVVTIPDGTNNFTTAFNDGMLETAALRPGFLQVCVLLKALLKSLEKELKTTSPDVFPSNFKVPSCASSVLAQTVAVVDGQPWGHSITKPTDPDIWSMSALIRRCLTTLRTHLVERTALQPPTRAGDLLTDTLWNDEQRDSFLRGVEFLLSASPESWIARIQTDIC